MIVEAVLGLAGLFALLILGVPIFIALAAVVASEVLARRWRPGRTRA